MDTLAMGVKACIMREAEASMKVFDWTKAKSLIKAYEKAWHSDVIAEAFLKEDEGNTIGEIYNEGKIVLNDHPYTSSIWATPIIRIINVNDGEYEAEIECWYTMDDVDKATSLATQVWPNIW